MKHSCAAERVAVAKTLVSQIRTKNCARSFCVNIIRQAIRDLVRYETFAHAHGFPFNEPAIDQLVVASLGRGDELIGSQSSCGGKRCHVNIERARCYNCIDSRLPGNGNRRGHRTEAVMFPFPTIDQLRDIIQLARRKRTWPPMT